MVQKRKVRTKAQKRSFLKEYNFEINVILLFGLGVFLLIEDLEIKEYIALALRIIILGIGNFIITLRDFTISIIKLFEISDLVGITFIFFAIYLVINRWKERMIFRSQLLIDCPDCGGKISRVHKKSLHRILGIIFFLNIKNYKCNKCSYKGIKLSK